MDTRSELPLRDVPDGIEPIHDGPEGQAGGGEGTMIRRSPDGKFCDPWFALDAWLPVLIRQARPSTVTEVLINAAMASFVRKAQSEYQAAADQLSHGGPSVNRHYSIRKHEAATRWLKKHDILVKALQDIEAIDRPEF